MNQIVKQLSRYKSFLILLVILGVFGYTGRQISQVVNSTPDPAAVEAQKEAASSSIVKIDIKTINSLGTLTPVNGASGVSATNKPDPFTP